MMTRMGVIATRRSHVRFRAWCALRLSHKPPVSSRSSCTVGCDLGLCRPRPVQRSAAGA